MEKDKSKTVTIKFDRVLEEKGKATKLRIPFKIDDRTNEYYWDFWLPKSVILIDIDNRMVIPWFFIYKLKEQLIHHSFSEVRYVARFCNFKIKFNFR